MPAHRAAASTEPNLAPSALPWRQPLRAALLACCLLGSAATLAAAPRCKQGQASVGLPDGGRYCGQMQGGKLHGQGRIDWGERQFYEGQFVHGFMQGQGRSGGHGWAYVGQFRRGAMHGKGRMTRGEAWVYEGDFVDNRMEGRGKLTLNKSYVYEGQFKNDQLSGHARMTDPSGSTIEGRFEDYQPTGPVTLTWATGDRYEGPVLGQMPHGEGVFTRADKAVLRGKFDYGSLDGAASIRYADGATYAGAARDNRAHGQGELRRPDGSVYTGQFANDQFDGPGRLTGPDGNVQAGYWRAGKYVGAQGDGTLADTPELAQRNNQTVLYNQAALLQRQWDQLQPSGPGAPRMYALYVAGDGRQEVFRREVTYVDELFARRFGTRGRSVSLVNSRSSTGQLPLATAHSIELALQALAQKMDRERDLLFVFLTSHGSEDHQLSLGMKGLQLPDLPAQRLGALLKASGIRNQVIVVSACYAGGFVPALQGERTWVITAARADRTSFGCADDNDFTYFGRALFKDSLAGQATLSEAFANADRLVREWEERDAAKLTEAARGARAPRRRAKAESADAAAADPSKPERSEPRSVVTPGFQAEVDAWMRAQSPANAP